jgi:AAHS family cis,cis-muconate transporter-like MFS transporter
VYDAQSRVRRRQAQPLGHQRAKMADAEDRLTSAGRWIATAVFVAMLVDGMDLQMLALALSSITKELHLSTVSAGALGTYTLVGMGIGGVLAGRLSDRIGRMRVIRAAIVTFTICTGVIGFVQEYWQIALMRFMSGFGIAALYSLGTLVVAEYVPTKIRTTVLGTVQAGWSAGYVAAALLSSYILPAFGWRPLFLCAIVPGLVALAMLHGLPDPPSWTASHSGKAGAEGGFTELWNDPLTRRNAVLWTFTSIALQFGYYGANTWLPSYLVRDLGVNLQSMGWYVAGTYTMMCAGKVITGFAADVFGRKALWVASGLLTAVYIPLFIFYGTPATIAYLLLVFGFLYGAPYAVNGTYMSESFPAAVRGTAVGAAYNLGRVGATLSPLLIGYVATEYSIGFGLALLGVSYLACALIPGLFIAERQFDPNAMKAAAPAVRSA